ncbi:6-phospho-3-hexuloisomerase [Clostridium sp. AM58-1XD]|uniref:6-phospho-3-hexuloisomerase n=1 Tax=Clostridium sp. AM58-1XD TaxID=2292307 RepID=UPI000E49987A|nr:6-phospho-3-hexuloisomerase [Clostridium sp. AM58-1XD]RGY96470.1 SIS domain-containing protein [Clostridium sp. AM58-1XD]
MLKEDLGLIVKEIEEALNEYDGQNDTEIIKSILSSGKIFVTGAGRSGYIMRCFAMRLIHLGFSAYVIGDTEMIAAKEGDLLMIGSGSGETKTLQVYMDQARKLGMKTILFTCNEDSTIARSAKFVCTINAQAKFQNKKLVSVQPMGSLFEQLLLIVTDGIILKLAKQMKIDFEQLKNRHSNLE